MNTHLTATDRSFGWYANRDRLIVEVDSVYVRADDYYIPAHDYAELTSLVEGLRMLARWNEKDVDVYVRRIIRTIGECSSTEVRDRLGTILVNFQVVTDDRARADVRQRIANQDVW